MTVGALVIGGVDGSIERWMERSMCRILEGRGADCTAASPKRKPLPDRRLAQTSFAAKQRPSFDGKGGAPFGRPGSVTFTAKKGKKGVRVKISGSTSYPTIDLAGCRIVTSSRAAAFELYGGASKEGKRFSASIEAFAGKESRYEVAVGPRRAAAIKAGKAQQPNPFDPRTIDAGESTTMSETFYRGTQSKAVLNNLSVSAGLKMGEKASASVTRVNGTTMRLSAGDEDFIERSTTLGLTGSPVSLSGSRQVGLANGRSLDVDISTDEGWAMYQTFVREGSLPKVAGRSASNSKQTTTVKASTSTDLGFDIGPISKTVPINASAFTRELTTNPKGGQDSTVTYRTGGLGLQIADPAGKTPSVYSLSVAGADPSLVEAFRRKQGLPQLENRSKDVRLEFSESQLASFAKRVGALDEGRPLSPKVGSFVRAMKEAKTPEDRLIAFAALAARDSGTDIMDTLVQLSTALSAKAKRDKGRPSDARFGAREATPKCPA